jgi:ribosome-binding ATPase YchF (GTP1/OBG family)
MLVGVIGKPNVGKSTFFSAATLRTVPIADYPFTTIKPNIGVAYLRTKCVHEEMGVIDQPQNSLCINGNRLVPVKIIDVAGLVKGASEGRGLGNQFLDELRQADALIHVVDASGATDEEGRKVPPGAHDPLKDIEMVEEEFDLWVLGIVAKDWEKAARTAEQSGSGIITHLAARLTGLGMKESDIEEVLFQLHLKEEKPTEWTKNDLKNFAKKLREMKKPSLIAANKADLPTSAENIERLRSTGRTIVPSASEAELLLRRAAEQGLVRYTPGDEAFSILDSQRLTPAQSRALQMVAETVMKRWGGTGVQRALNGAYFELLRAIVVFPVEDEHKLIDKKGNVLPDAYVVRGGSTALDLAATVHSELAKGFLYAIDVRTGMRLAAEYRLKDRDIVKIVSSGKRL